MGNPSLEEDFLSRRRPPIIRVVLSFIITVVSVKEVSTMGILLPVGVVRVEVTEETSGLTFMVIYPSSFIVGVTDSCIPTSTKVTSSEMVLVVEPVEVVVVT